MSIEINKENLIEIMAENLIILRTKLRLTQTELANKVGISRQTIMNIENNKRLMTWNVFVGLLCVFREDRYTSSLIEFLGIYTPELKRYLTAQERVRDSANKDGGSGL
jgi:DNA-binding XRE family transcriptional regulator